MFIPKRRNVIVRFVSWVWPYVLVAGMFVGLAILAVEKLPDPTTPCVAVSEALDAGR